MGIQTPLRAEHEKLGARLGTYFGCTLPSRYSDSGSEYRAARERVALLDTNYRVSFSLEGPDRVRYLNAMVTGNIRDLAAGQGTAALLLNAQGHILAEVECYALEDRLLALSHACVADRTLPTLDKYIIMDDVTLRDTSEEMGTVAIEGPQASDAVHALTGIKLAGMPNFSHVETAVDSLPARLIRRAHFGEAGAELLAERARLPELWEKLLAAVRTYGGAPIGYETLNLLRLEAGIPWFGYDYDDKVIPQEAGLDASHISFTKGCYTGQEIVERVRSRGHVNRRLMGMVFLRPIPPEPGTKLFSGEQEAGQVTSAAFSPSLGICIGMGYVRREHSAPGSKLAWPGGDAEVVELPVAPAKLARGKPAGETPAQ